MSNCERIGRKKSAAQGGRSYAEARESVAKSYKVDNLEHPSREYHYRRADSIVKGSSSAGLRFPRFTEDGDAKEMPVPRDLNSRSRGTGISFARNNDLPEKKSSAYFPRSVILQRKLRIHTSNILLIQIQ
jgi:hypothetical protein